MKEHPILEKLFLITMIIFFVVIFVGFTVVEIYVWVVYGNVPVSEIPAWVLFFMFGGKG